MTGDGEHFAAADRQERRIPPAAAFLLAVRLEVEAGRRLIRRIPSADERQVQVRLANAAVMYGPLMRDVLIDDAARDDPASVAQERVPGTHDVEVRRRIDCGHFVRGDVEDARAIAAEYAVEIDDPGAGARRHEGRVN